MGTVGVGGDGKNAKTAAVRAGPALELRMLGAALARPPGGEVRRLRRRRRGGHGSVVRGGG